MGALARERRQSVYVSTIKGLADNVRELLWSLGIKNAMTEEPSTRYGRTHRRNAVYDTVYHIRRSAYLTTKKEI